MALTPGGIVGGKYRVERVLGEGGMGIVVAATHLQLGQTVALKCMRPEVVSPSYTKRFMREARASVKLKSQHAARVLDVGAFEDGTPYIVMEHLEGRDLSDLLKIRGRLPVPEAVEYILQACEAIGEAHSYGIVHRDIKPANLFLAEGPGGAPTIKVLDFGVSKFLDIEAQADDTNPGGKARSGSRRPPARTNDSVVTRATDLLGSPSYMAPEQVLNASAADTRSDIWSLGVILFKLVCGRGPFTAESLGELVQQVMKHRIPTVAEILPECPPGFSEVVARCLERDRLKRYTDIPELARALAPYAPHATAPSLERAAILGPSFSYTPAPPVAISHAPIAPTPLGVAGAQLRLSTPGQFYPAGAQGAPRPVPAGPPVHEPPRYGLAIVAAVAAVLAFFMAAYIAGRSAPPPHPVVPTHSGPVPSHPVVPLEAGAPPPPRPSGAVLLSPLPPPVPSGAGPEPH